MRAAVSAGGEMELQAFFQRLALHLTSWQVTTFLVGEYGDTEIHNNPIFTVADGIIWLSRSVERNSIVRKLQVMKERGAAPMPGRHTFRITDDGIQVFPRIIRRPETPPHPYPRPRVCTGVTILMTVEIGGYLRKMITVVKMRSSEHTKELRQYEVTSHGIGRSCAFWARRMARITTQQKAG